MQLFRSLADIVGRLVSIIAPASSGPQRPPTEDDIRYDRYLRANRARG